MQTPPLAVCQLVCSRKRSNLYLIVALVVDLPTIEEAEAAGEAEGKLGTSVEVSSEVGGKLLGGGGLGAIDSCVGNRLRRLCRALCVRGCRNPRNTTG